MVVVCSKSENGNSRMEIEEERRETQEGGASPAPTKAVQTWLVIGGAGGVGGGVGAFEEGG